MSDLAELVAVARGDKPAELVLQNAQVLNLFTGALEQASIAIHNGKIAGLGDYESDTTLDLKGSVVAPGFIDSHFHIESSLLRPEEFARTLIPLGTTTVIADPHEIANVAGMEGLRYFAEVAERLPIDIFFTVPSAVPSTTPELETSGSELGVGSVLELINHPRYIGLGEVMNYPSVVAGESEVMAKIEAARGKPIDGHCPGLSGKELNAYIAAGPSSDHESTEAKEGREKISRGMALVIRQSSVAKDFEKLVQLVNYMTARRCLMCSDDRTALDLMTEGGIDMLVKMAIERETDPRLALQMVTLNPAEHYGLSDRGSVTPGRIADLIVLEDLTSVYLRMVFKNGKCIFSEGHMLVEVGEMEPPVSLLNSVRIGNVKQEFFEIVSGGGNCRIIGYRQGQIITDSLVELVEAREGRLASDTARDIIQIAVVNRYSDKPKVSNGLIKGFGLKRGAIATSVSHDAHNIVIAGVDPASMATAANAVIKTKGGMAAALNDAVLAELPLEIAGLMSLKPAGEVVRGMRSVLESAAFLGSTLEDPFIALSFMSLAVIPNLKITDRGLVDVARQELVALVVEEEMRRAA